MIFLNLKDSQILDSQKFHFFYTTYALWGGEGGWRSRHWWGRGRSRPPWCVLFWGGGEDGRSMEGEELSG